MSKFKVGDRVKYPVSSDTGTIMRSYNDYYEVKWDDGRYIEFKKKLIDSACILVTEKDEDFPVPMGEIVSGGIVSGNSINDGPVDIVLAPGDIWIPRECAEEPEVIPPKPNPETCYHTWQDVLLLQFTVTECSKCGKRKDEK